MTQMIVEIRGTGTHNRGAKLMADAICQHLRALHPDTVIAVPPKFWRFMDRSCRGLHVLNSFPIRTFSGLVASVAPRKLRETVGIVNRWQVDAILDASGFAYSDQWGSGPAASLRREMSRPWRRGQKLILLPQAFGPCERPEVADACRAVFARADLVYARDPDSFAAVEALGVARNLRLCPDFTAVVSGVAPQEFPVAVPFGAIVPNYRMLDKTSAGTGTVYLDFLARGVEAIRKVGLQPVLILHDEEEDKALLPQLFTRTRELPVFESSSPRVLKGALGMAEIVIGSRYHALISALSQGTPCIGAGWSHKYKWLFEDYGCGDCLVGNLEDPGRLERLVKQICASDARPGLIAELRNRGAGQLEKIEGMWKEVDTFLGIDS